MVLQAFSYGSLLSLYGTLTELEAVNGMLMAIHEQPVNTLEDDGILELAIAKQTITEVSRAVQSRGWHFNTLTNVSLVPSDPDREIVLPWNTLRVDTVGCSRIVNVAQRGKKLFNIAKGTFKFENPVTVDMILFLPFDEIIQPAREYIMIKATRRFQARVMGSQVIEYFSEKEEIQAKSVLDQAEHENADYNFLMDNPLTRYTVQRDRYL